MLANLPHNTPRRTALETWIYGYLKKLSKGNNTRSEKKFIEKAIALIYAIFGIPCCYSDESFATLITPNDNELTHTIKQLYHKDKVIRRDHRLSLLRIKDLLTDALYGQCCTGTTTIEFVDLAASASIIQVYDPLTGDLLLQSDPSGSTTQSFSVPKKYFGKSAYIKICITNTTSSFFTILQNGDATQLATNPTIGKVCSLILQPLQSEYIVSSGS